MRYTKRTYRFKSVEDFSHKMQHRIPLTETIGNSFIQLTPEGVITLRKGYASDGRSGPFPKFMQEKYLRAWFVHDAGYQLIREGLVDREYKEAFDQEMRLILLSLGMFPSMADFCYWSVHRYGHPAATHSEEVLEA